MPPQSEGGRGIDADPSLFISTFGSGRPILCLHGIEAHGLRFLGLSERMPGVKVVAPDLRGHGRSPIEGPWTIEQHLADILPILDGLGPEAMLLGHSYGGLIAWEVARAAPERLAGLILVDPAISVGAEVARRGVDDSVSLRRWANEGDAFLELAVSRPETGLWSVALDVAAAIRRDAEGWLRPTVARAAVHAGWQQMQELLRPTEWRGPTLLLEAGQEHGIYVSAGVVKQMGAQLGEALDHVVLDAIHSIPSDYPDPLAEHVGDFTRRHRNATRS